MFDKLFFRPQRTAILMVFSVCMVIVAGYSVTQLLSECNNSISPGRQVFLAEPLIDAGAVQAGATQELEVQVENTKGKSEVRLLGAGVT